MGDRMERTTRRPPSGCAWKIGKHRTWHLSRIPASRRARRVRQHRSHHVSRGHRGHFTKLSPISAMLGCIGQGSTLGLMVTRATATVPMLGGPWKATCSPLKQSHHHRNIRFNTSPISPAAFHAARPSISSSSFHQQPASNSINTPSQHPAYTPPGLSAHHVGAGRPELRQRQPQEQRQRQVLCNNARRQLQQTKHPWVGWHRKHHRLQQRAHKHHGASGVQQEIRGGRRWWMWQDLSSDQLQPGRVPRGECELMRDAMRGQEVLTDSPALRTHSL